MSEWIAYTGTDEQIEEMLDAENGFIIRSRGIESNIMHKIDRRGLLVHCDEYLICNPHPLANMICRQAATGQPVYWRNKSNGKCGECSDNGHWWYKPFYATDICDYSFTPFEEEK